MNIVPASLGKRTGAAIIDLLIAAMVWFGLLAYAIQPIFNNSFGLPAIQEDYQAIQIESKLYELDEEYETVSVLAAEDYDTGVLAYYTEYKGETIAWYNTEILLIGEEDSLFVYVYVGEDPQLDVLGVPAPIEGSGTMTSEELSSATANQAGDLETFYYNAYTAARTDLNAQPAYLALANELAYYFKWELAIATSFVILVFYLLIPMLLKDGRTLGKQLFGISLVNKSGYRVKKWQIAVRALVFGVFEIFGAVYTMMGTILISYTIMIFGKKNMSIHDFVASTRVLDAKRSVWFNNPEEAAAYQAELDKNATKSVLGAPVYLGNPVAPEVLTPSEPTPAIDESTPKDDK